MGNLRLRSISQQAKLCQKWPRYQQNQLRNCYKVKQVEDIALYRAWTPGSPPRIRVQRHDIGLNKHFLKSSVQAGSYLISLYSTWDLLN